MRLRHRLTVPASVLACRRQAQLSRPIQKSALKERGILACGLAHRLWSGDITRAAGGVPVEIFFHRNCLFCRQQKCFLQNKQAIPVLRLQLRDGAARRVYMERGHP